MQLYTLHGNNEKFYYAKILNDKAPYYLDFVHISETKTKPLLIGDYCTLLRSENVKKESVSSFSPVLSLKAFNYLYDLIKSQIEDIIELQFENRIFYIVIPKLMTFTDSFNWPLLTQELPENIHFFRESIHVYRPLVTQEFKDICDKHKLKGMCFELKYDSEATP